MAIYVIMYWDRVNPLGDPTAGLDITGDQDIEIPAEACGFRLGLPDHEWSGAWYFAEPGNPGATFRYQGIEYSSKFVGEPSPDAIVAIGPVHGCTSGAYQFQTPLGSFGISGDDPIVAGAGSFVAEFFDEDDIEWLDAAGKELPKKEKPPGSPPKLPREFFESPPEVKGCFRDFEGKLHCPEPASGAPAGPGPGARTLERAMAVPDLARLIEAGQGFLPYVRAVRPQVALATSVSGGQVITRCPAELILTATFYKDYTFEPAVVRYRFRFAHGPVSTVFSTMVDKEGANAVTHAVPIPLPPPIGQTPSGRPATPRPGGLAVIARRTDPIDPGPTAPEMVSDFTAEPLPPNEHKGSVRVEVLNAFEGVVSSGWETYHLVCTEAPSGPTSRARER